MFRKSVARPAPGAGAPKPKYGLVTLVHVDDILYFPQYDETEVVIVGNIVLKDGAKMITVYETDDSQKASHSIEGEADAEGFMKKFEGSHPGDSIEINEFVQKTIGQPVLAIYRTDCGSNTKKVVGTPCNPLYLGGEFTDDKDAVKHTLNFAQRKRDRHVSKFYTGELLYAENFVAANALVVTEANGPVYKLPVSNVAATTVTVATMTMPAQKVISLIGSGGTNPSTLAAGVTGPVTVLLNNGTAWAAEKDAVLNLKVMNAGAITYLIELSRS